MTAEKTEQYYLWFTVNILLHQLHSQQPLVLLNLDSSSLDITFQSRYKAQAFQNTTITLRSLQFEDLGLVAIRRSIKQFANFTNSFETNYEDIRIFINDAIDERPVEIKGTNYFLSGYFHQIVKYIDVSAEDLELGMFRSIALYMCRFNLENIDVYIDTIYVATLFDVLGMKYDTKLYLHTPNNPEVIDMSLGEDYAGTILMEN